MNTWAEAQIKKLPASMMKYLASPLLTKQMNEIVDLFEMSEEEKQDVKDEIYLFALGGTSPVDFPTRIQLYSGLEDEKAEILTEKIVTQILDPIAEEMVNFWMSELPEIPENTALTTNNVGSATPRTTPLSSPTYKPSLKKTVTDQDMADARKALSDRYREPLQ